MAVKNLFQSNKKVLGNENSMFNEVLWDTDNWDNNSVYIVKGFDSASRTSLIPITPSFKTNTLKPGVAYFNTLDETSGQLKELYKSEMGYEPPPIRPYWDGVLMASNNHFFEINNLVLKTTEPGSTHVHSHNVLKNLSFRDIAVQLKFKRNDGSAYSKVILLQAPANYKSYVGAEGKKDKQLRYQLGVKQEFEYYIKLNNNKYICILLELSVVFMYHGNDFEPLGVIDAVKFFPQIRFTSHEINFTDKNLYPANSDRYNLPEDEPSMNLISLTDLPTDIDTNSCKIHSFKGRVKMTANNNNSHHVDIRPDGNGNYIDYNHLRNLREIGYPIPEIIEKYFDNSIVNSNVPGFFTDSNYSGKDQKNRMTPRYHLAYVFPPTWQYIFDYVKPDITQETEIQATYGFQDKTSENADKFKAERIVKYTYPSGTDNFITLMKTSRQGEYDNIHFHGYMGKYADNNLPVIHAPICGFCCFHLHWRWAKLNYDLNSSYINQLILAKGDPTRFNGWTNEGINDGTGFGLPLIPPNQSLKIAITNEDKTPFSIDLVLDPDGDNSTLDYDIKSVWYSVDVLNPEIIPSGSYVVLEQGAGYAFRYSASVENVFRNAKTITKILIPELAVLDDLHLLLTNVTFFNLLSTADLFEITYRLMRVFNTGTYANLEQVPRGNYRPNINEPSMEKL